MDKLAIFWILLGENHIFLVIFGAKIALHNSDVYMVIEQHQHHRIGQKVKYNGQS